MSKAIGVFFALWLGVGVCAGILYVVGETVEHFTPEEEECPPFYQCTPTGDWNAKNCDCWERKK